MASSPHRLLALLLALSLPGCGNDEAKPPVASAKAPAPAAPPRPDARPPAAKPGNPTDTLSAGSRPLAPVPAGRPEPAAEAAGPGVSRWYDNLQDGQKLGTLHVLWAPSTWKGKPTVRDTTTMTSTEARKMGGFTDVFRTTSTSTTERGEDGTFWWSSSTVTEAGNRKTTTETTWTGDGYESVTRLNGVEERHRVATTAPVPLDAESFLGPKIVRGEAKPGSTWTLKQLDMLGGRVAEEKLEVLGVEPGPSEAGDVPCTKVRQTDPETKSETLLWFDRDGALARVKVLSDEIRRVSPETARKRPATLASFSITVPASPPLERVFSADRLLVDLHLRGDPDRPLPEFPSSPWSRVTGVEGSDAEGWTVHAELTAYDAPGARATIPVADPAFAKDLESTVFLCLTHPDVIAAAKRIVGTETDARKAAQKIADFVFTLKKQSPEVGEATAVEILRDRQGDCSEHALLFVALCRAAGIPARRCSGFVCVGSIWGAHAWAEIWTGAWMGVDPTTNDVGQGARYLFYGYDDDPKSHPGLVTARARGRMRIETTHLDEGQDHVDLSDPEHWRVVDNDKKVASHRLAGLEFRDWPSTWSIDLQEDANAFVKGPGFTATVGAMADQGSRGVRYLQRYMGPFSSGRETRFAGAPAVSGRIGTKRQVMVSSRRRIVQVDLDVDDDSVKPDEVMAALEKVMAKTFAPKP